MIRDLNSLKTAAQSMFKNIELARTLIANAISGYSEKSLGSHSSISTLCEGNHKAQVVLAAEIGGISKVISLFVHQERFDSNHSILVAARSWLLSAANEAEELVQALSDSECCFVPADKLNFGAIFDNLGMACELCKLVASAKEIPRHFLDLIKEMTSYNLDATYPYELISDDEVAPTISTATKIGIWEAFSKRDYDALPHDTFLTRNEIADLFGYGSNIVSKWTFQLRKDIREDPESNVMMVREDSISNSQKFELAEALKRRGKIDIRHFFLLAKQVNRLGDVSNKANKILRNLS